MVEDIIREHYMEASNTEMPTSAGASYDYALMDFKPIEVLIGRVVAVPNTATTLKVEPYCGGRWYMVRLINIVARKKGIHYLRKHIGQVVVVRVYREDSNGHILGVVVDPEGEDIGRKMFVGGIATLKWKMPGLETRIWARAHRVAKKCGLAGARDPGRMPTTLDPIE
jgi:hypothetical protein